MAFADQTLSANAEVIGFIYAVLDANTVRVIFAGEIPTVGSSFLEGGGSLVPGSVYFLAATAGKVTATEPTTIGYVSKPLGVAVSTTKFSAFNMRGSVVGAANARTQITLANNATTTVQDVSLYDAGYIEGWVYIDAPTDVRFYVKAPFSKYGAAANYYISPSYVGDTPTVGYSMTITAAGLIQITLPSIASFTSAVINFALNAPAVGTNFPLNLDSANLTNSGITGLTGTAATTAVTSGSLKIGEEKRLVASGVSITSASNITIVGPITITAGVWIISSLGAVGGTSISQSEFFLATAANSNTGRVANDNGINGSTSATTNTTSGSIPNYLVNLTSGTQTWYLNTYTTGTALSGSGRINAIRIA